MSAPRKTPVELAEDAVRRAEAEFMRNPNNATESKLSGARLFLKSVKDRAANDPGFNIRPPES